MFTEWQLHNYVGKMGALNPSVTSVLGGDTIQPENEVTHIGRKAEKEKPLRSSFNLK